MPQSGTNAAPRKRRTPKLRHHKASNQGYVEFNGVRRYLGVYDKPETLQRYHQQIAVWLANGQEFPLKPDETTIVELCERYYAWAETYFRRPDGTVSSELGNVERALRPLKRLFATMPAKDFGPQELKAIRESLIGPRMIRRGKKLVEHKLARRGINQLVSRMRHVFKWGAAEGMCPPSVWHALQCVDGLKAGRSLAKESREVKPVPLAHVNAVLPHVSRQVAAVVELQLLTAARPSELLNLRPVDIDTRCDVWEVRLNFHKSAHRGRERVLFIGPKAQAILKQFLYNRPLDTGLFSPKEAEDERYASSPKDKHRRENQKANPKKTDRILRDCYDANSYRKAILRGCAKADVPRWFPYQLRHTAATAIRREYGLEATQVALGHAVADVTQVYAERDFDKARAVFAAIG